MEPEVQYQLKAFVNDVEVYTTSTASPEVIQMSLNDAEFAVGKEIDELLSMHLGGEYVA